MITVRELIEELSEHDPQMGVVILIDGQFYKNFIVERVVVPHPTCAIYVGISGE